MDLKIINIASNTDNNRNIKDRTHHSKLKNPLCGDELQIELIIKNNKIVDFGYYGKSCVFCQASASLLSKISINNKKDKINSFVRSNVWAVLPHGQSKFKKGQIIDCFLPNEPNKILD